MKIGVISDTHGNVTALRKALGHFDGAELIVHAGDVLYHPPRLGCDEDYDIPSFAETLNSVECPVLVARGNCDPEVCGELLDTPVQSPYAVAEVEGLWVVACHGHLLDRNEMIRLGRRFRARYFISGHTHIPVLESVGDLVLMNPGSPAIPKCEPGGTPVPTVGIIDDSGARIIGIDDCAVIAQIGRQ